MALHVTTLTVFNYNWYVNKVVKQCAEQTRCKYKTEKTKPQVILTPSASSKSGTGLPLQLETTILSPMVDAVTRKLSELGVTDHRI